MGNAETKQNLARTPFLSASGVGLLVKPLSRMQPLQQTEEV